MVLENLAKCRQLVAHLLVYKLVAQCLKDIEIQFMYLKSLVHLAIRALFW